MSADPENEFFSDGMTEELINALTEVEGLRVASRTSAFAFKGRDVDVREIGQRLNVTTVLEGSVRRAGNRLRVTAQLIDAADGYHLWSETYDRELADVFAVQDELSRSIVKHAPAQAPAGAARHRAAGRAGHGRSRGLHGVSQGPLLLEHAHAQGAIGRGIEMFEAALARDPGFALPYTGLADCWAMLGFDFFGGVPPGEGMPRAKAAAQRALELDDSLAEAYSPLGVVAMLWDWDWAEAERCFRRSLELKPGLRAGARCGTPSCSPSWSGTTRAWPLCVTRPRSSRWR